MTNKKIESPFQMMNCSLSHHIWSQCNCQMLNVFNLKKVRNVPSIWYQISIAILFCWKREMRMQTDTGFASHLTRCLIYFKYLFTSTSSLSFVIAFFNRYIDRRSHVFSCVLIVLYGFECLFIVIFLSNFCASFRSYCLEFVVSYYVWRVLFWFLYMLWSGLWVSICARTETESLTIHNLSKNKHSGG